MSKEKQIEEMAKVLCCDYGECEYCICEKIESETEACTIKSDCEELYNAGYRKQSEGEWENVYEYNAYEMRRERKTACSQCGYKPKGDIFGKTPFCPNCGAKMKGGAE